MSISVKMCIDDEIIRMDFTRLSNGEMDIIFYDSSMKIIDIDDLSENMKNVIYSIQDLYIDFFVLKKIHLKKYEQI